MQAAEIATAWNRMAQWLSSDRTGKSASFGFIDGKHFCRLSIVGRFDVAVGLGETQEAAIDQAFDLWERQS